VAISLVSQLASAATQRQILSVLVTAVIVVALYVFVGNSGVISFGQVSFVAVGAFAAGLATAPANVKPTTFPNLAPVLADLEMGNISSLLLAAALGGLFAFITGIPLMRLSGLSAGIATFALLIVTNNVFRNWEAIGPGAKTLSLIPQTTGFIQATVGLVLVMAIAFAYQTSRPGRRLRATREDALVAQSSGIDVHRERLWAFIVSGSLAGFAGGLLVHLIGSITTEQVFLDLTFITLAMLVFGGIGSMWGALIGALAIAGLNALLAEATRGISIGSFEMELPGGARLMVLGLLMVLVLLFKPNGVTGSRELRWPLR
jgi:branched-chain amino acid transport system permease protein